MPSAASPSSFHLLSSLLFCVAFPTVAPGTQLAPPG